MTQMDIDISLQVADELDELWQEYLLLQKEHRRLVKRCDHKMPNGKTALCKNGTILVCIICRRYLPKLERTVQARQALLLDHGFSEWEEP